jgi:diazepam-binding inhibitor (GABA receptor modulating acyl-CoA-binding protein)
MSLEQKFNKAAEEVKALASRPSNDDLLYLYKYYKQSTAGDCNTSCPGMFDFEGKSKWNAWNSVKATKKDDAMIKYIAKVESLKKK